MKFKDVLIGIVVVILIYIIYVYLFSDSSKKRLIQIHNAEDEFTITRKKLPMTRGQYEYSFSIWFFISNWTSTSGTKTILFMSDKPSGGINDYEWSLTLGGTVNSLQFNYRTGNKGIGKNSCEIPNIPIQRWVHLVLVMHNKTLDVYINGKLKRSCIYKQVPKYNTDDLHITDNGGFKGDLSEFKYFNKALSPSEIYGIYSSGYQTMSLYDKLSKLKPKINLNVSVSASANDRSVSASSN